MRVLVCGGRDFGKGSLHPHNGVYVALDRIHARTPITSLLQGGAGGADLFARRWADKYQIRCETYRPDWHIYDLAAGPIRNQRMLDEGHPDLVVAFPGGRGTRSMVRLTRKAGVTLLEVDADGEELHE